jgi:hypothetical protein
MDAERRFTVQKGKLQRREMERKLAKACSKKITKQLSFVFNVKLKGNNTMRYTTISKV